VTKDSGSAGQCYVTVTLMTFDEQSNARRTSVELKSNRSCEHRVSCWRDVWRHDTTRRVASLTTTLRRCCSSHSTRYCTAVKQCCVHIRQEAQLMLTTGATRLAVSRGQQT